MFTLRKQFSGCYYDRYANHLINKMLPTDRPVFTYRVPGKFVKIKSVILSAEICFTDAVC